jgi:L-alanine-DL-glutamate epimerase-like enolase superfamily enzyme
LRIERIEQTTVPISSGISNAVISFAAMDVSFVAVVADDGTGAPPLVGFGFNSNGRYAQPGLLAERFIPRLLAANPDELCSDELPRLDPRLAAEVMMRNEKPGGHGDRAVAVGILDMALWDLAAKAEGLPLYRLLARLRGAAGPVAERVFVYAAGGYYEDGKGDRQLQEEILAFLAAGYTTVKIKIGGAPLADDRRRIEAAIDVLPGPHCLAVDANARFEIATALEYAAALEPYGLRWFEEPGDPLDFELHNEVAAAYAPPLATGENLFSTADSRNLIRYGGLRPDRDVLQFDPALSYGLPEYMRTIEMIEAAGWSRTALIPHGGHQMALAVAAGLGIGGNESYPGVFAPFGGFADGVAVEDGQISLPEEPGIGLELKAALRPIMRELAG